MMSTKAHRKRCPRGITLLEALLAAVVLAMAAGAVILPFTAGAQCTVQDARQTMAVNLAQDMMEEILSKPFSDPDGDESGETGPSTWDDVDDYSGYQEAAGNIRSFDGVLVEDPAAVGLSRHVTVADVYVWQQETTEPPTFVRITVEVRYKGVQVVSLSRLLYANDL
jgi:MSHA pilin protein MshD